MISRKIKDADRKKAQPRRDNKRNRAAYGLDVGSQPQFGF